MAKKRENEPENEVRQAESDMRPPEGEKVAPRLSVQLESDGSIAWDRMRADTREKLTQAIGRSNVVPFAPAATTAGAAVSESIPPEICELLYDSASQLMIGLARRSGYSQDQAQILTFNSQEKHALVPVTVKIFDKYNANLGKFAEEIMLATLLTTIITGKLTLLRKSADVRAFPSQTPPAGGSQGENNAS